jgi:hypothetical protein
MTTYNIIELGKELVLNEGVAAGAQFVVNGHGNGNALGNTLVTITPTASSETLAQFVDGLKLERGHTYIGETNFDTDYNDYATFIVTDTQSGKIGAISLIGIIEPSFGGSIIDHVLTLT